MAASVRGISYVSQFFFINHRNRIAVGQTLAESFAGQVSTNWDGRQSCRIHISTETEGKGTENMNHKNFKQKKPIDTQGHLLPNLTDCRSMPRKYRSASNDVLSVLSAQGYLGARKERLLREIMSKENCTWPEARKKLYEINVANDKYGTLFQLPYRIGILLGVAGGVGCIPLVFHRETALWFNSRFVQEEVPDDLSNFWQVGEWTWSWMEPALGTLSFTLLGLQLSRQYMQKMEWSPYAERVNKFRADRLAKLYPQYETEIVRDFAKSDSWVDTTKVNFEKLVEHEIRMGIKEDENDKMKKNNLKSSEQ